MSSPEARPTLRIVSGSPTPEELAVLTALVTAAGSGSDEPVEAPQRGRWNDPAAMHRRALLPGPGGWRGSR
ncbi:acyl-CoA carboxylase subunit epsilon [Jatrophihabitans sp.]|uniref:acyl-CoA carboxylase subunit epsilon n=1 Tax=Jatrophihabitans sp. TaxID=1932789 RepID=UPI0030C77529|nr:Acyl-CoA carboxylase epsilon subunit [Jatrophihabitans sp.]